MKIKNRRFTIQAIVFLSSFLILVSWQNTAAAANYWPLLERNIGTNSVANVNQLKELYESVTVELSSSHNNIESLAVLNVKLRQLNLPEIQINSRNLLIKMAKQIGFDTSFDIGVEISDGSYTFCLPCTVGHNNYKTGIFKGQN